MMGRFKIFKAKTSFLLLQSVLFFHTLFIHSGIQDGHSRSEIIDARKERDRPGGFAANKGNRPPT